MKIYATTTSERATKGQGGNEYIDIEIYINDRNNPRYMIQVTPEGLVFNERGYSQALLERKHEDLFPKEEKGKRQKGEKCHCQYHDENGKCTDTPL